MPQENIPEAVRRLVVDLIPSVERLEILLLVFEARPRTWTTEEIQDRIRSAPESIRQNIAALVAARVCAPEAEDPARVRYLPQDAELDAIVTDLAKVYRAKRVAVIELIYADRRDALRSFSEAFKFGKPHGR